MAEIFTCASPQVKRYYEACHPFCTLWCNWMGAGSSAAQEPRKCKCSPEAIEAEAEENIKRMQNNKSEYAQLVNEQGFAYWTRFCIWFREIVQVNYFNAAYMPELCDPIFIKLLQGLDSYKGEEKLIEFFLDTWRVFKKRKSLPNIQTIISCQKGAAKMSMKQSLEEVFPPQLLKFAGEKLNLQSTTPIEQEMIQGQMMQILRTRIVLFNCFSHVIQTLRYKPQEPTDWKMPASWEHPQEYPLLAFEEYLRDRWDNALADDVLGVETEDINWWYTERSDRQDFLAAGYKANLPRVQSLERKATMQAFLPDSLKEDFPSLLGVICKCDFSVERLFRGLPEDTLCETQFKCYQLTVPPILAVRYYSRLNLIPEDVNPVVAAWFATWCTMMEGVNIHSVLYYPNTWTSSPNHMTHAHFTLSHWGPPAEIQLKDVLGAEEDFLGCLRAAYQIISNSIHRQQWLAAALSTVMKFELQILPLRFWPVPEKFSKDVVELMSFLKVTKEIVLLGLYAHEQNSLVDFQYFRNELMPLAIFNFGIMKSAKVIKNLEVFKRECSASDSGSIPQYCWRLDADIEKFYSEHPWNFQFYQSYSGYTPPKDFSFNEKADKVLGMRHKRHSKTSSSNDNFELDWKNLIITSDFCDFLCKIGWEEGEFVKRIISAIAEIGLIPKNVVMMVVEKVSVDISAFNDCSNLDTCKKIWLLCLALLQLESMFRAKGRILHGSPQMLVGNVISLSLQLHEQELLYTLVHLVGKLCDYAPIIRCKSRSSGQYSGPITLENVDAVNKMKAELLQSQRGLEQFALCPKPHLLEQGQTEADLRIFFLLLVFQHRYSDLDLTGGLRQGGALLQHLLPCYLGLLPTSGFNAKGLIFLHFALREYFWQIRNSKIPRTLEPSHINSIHCEILKIQNKILQIFNAFVDHGSGCTSKKLAEIFASTNWIFKKANKMSTELMALCFPNYSVIHHHYETLYLAFAHTVETVPQLLAVRTPHKLTPSMVTAYIYQQVNSMTTSVLKAVADHTDTTIPEAAKKKLDLAEDKAHWWASKMYFCLTVDGFQDDPGENFFEDAIGAFKAPLTLINKHYHDLVLTEDLDWEKGLEEMLQMNENAAKRKSTANYFMKEWSRFEKIRFHELTESKQLNDLLMGFDSSVNVSQSKETSAKKKKVKKFLKPSKEVVGFLEQKSKEQVRRTCKMCKKKESTHKQNFITCAECIKTKFPKITHFCSKACEKQAWEAFHDVHHTLFSLDLYDPSEDEAEGDAQPSK